MTEIYEFLRGILASYAHHFDVVDEGTTYVLNEELPQAQTLFGWTRVGRTGVRFVFYPLDVFPELREALPPLLADQVRSKCSFLFKALTTPERDALAEMVASGYARVAEQRALAPRQSYARKLDVEQVEELVAAAIVRAHSRATASRRKTDVVVTLPAGRRAKGTLATREKKPGTLVLKTLTPAEYSELVTLLT